MCSMTSRRRKVGEGVRPYQAAAADDARFGALLNFLIYTGARLGEALA
jgi:hypothetical protein